MTIDPKQRLITVRDEAWSVIANNAWGNSRWLYFAQLVYDLCAQAVGKHPRDKS